MYSPRIISLLQSQRAQTFPRYREITLARPALQLLEHLFLNPDCQADIDLASLTGEEVALHQVGEHIITAAPATLAQYAHRHEIWHLQAADLLRCFALDHAHDISANDLDKKKGARYALAHLLNIAEVSRLYEISGHTMIDGFMPLPAGKVIFKKILLPPDLPVAVGEQVYHHFGVAVAKADDLRFAQRLVKLQRLDQIVMKWVSGIKNRGSNLVIDFSDQRIFSEDVTGRIMHPHTVAAVKKPQDIDKGKVKFQK